MLKRIFVLLLCLLLLVSLPVTAFAATTEEEEEEEQRICDQISDFYRKIVRATGVYNLEGWCGLMAGWELYLLGVINAPWTYNGNDQYNAYEKLEVTNTGHKVSLYPATVYTIEETLNTITRSGTMDVYNIMAGFHKTRTAAGQKWGHVTVIHAVLDGNVYYTEGFDTDYGLNPSLAQVCSIEEWADLYESWTTPEGIVYFGTKAWEDFCTYYSANLFVVSDQAVTLVSDPGSPELSAVRTAVPGERLHAIGLYESAEGQLYYQINDSDAVCFVAADTVKPYRFDYSDVTVQNAVVPETLELGADFDLAGDIYSTNNRLGNICIQVLDADGNAVLQWDYVKDSCFTDLSRKEINNRVDFSQLTEGHYTYRVCADVTNHYAAEGQVMEDRRSVELINRAFTVGTPGDPQLKSTEVLSTDPPQSWQYENGAWYYYTNGTPRTGWFCENGLDYYLLEDGTAATGWHEINGRERFFSVTGVMRTGWLDTRQGAMYMLRNGVAAVGWRTIGDKLYCFDENGLLLTDCTAERDGTVYVLGTDGVAAVQE